MTQRRLTDPLYIYADPMKGVAHGPAIPLLGAAFATFGPLGGALTIGGATLSLGASFLIRAAIGLALNALAPKPPRLQSQQQGYQVTAFGSALDHQVIYGETRIAGARVFDGATGSDNKFLHRVIAFAGHEVEGFSEVYLNDYKLTVNLTTGAVTSAQNSEETTNRYNNRVRIISRNGTDSQTAISEMVSEIPEWTSAHRLRGIAYLYIRFEFDADVFPNGIPEVTATVKGRKVFDPRTSTTAWSDNPALCLRDYLTNSRFGMGATAGEIDDVLVAQAANVCEETVEAQSRYTLNGAFTTDAAPADILQNMLTSMGGLLWHAQGAWRMKPAYYTAPVLALGLDDLRTGLQIQTRAARRDNFNTVRGTFRGAESDWQVTDYKPVTDSAFVAADGGFDTAIDLDLPFTSSHLTAQRIARIALQQQREQVTVSGRFGLRAFQVQVGDTVTITNPRLGWTNKEFEVVTWTFTLTQDMALEVQMTLRETSSAVYASTPGAVFEANNTSLPSPFLNVAPQNLQAVTSAFIATDGTYVNSIDVTWDAPDDAFVDHYEIEWRKTTVTEFSGATTSATEFIIPSVDDDASYAIRVRAVNLLGVRGPFTSITFNAGPDVTPPGEPTSLSVVGRFGYFNLQWVSPTDRDFDYLEVWESETSSLGAASQIAVAYGNTFVRGNVAPGVTRFFWIRAVDASGNKSDFVGPQSATSAFVDDGDFVDGVVNLFLDQGLGPIPSGNTFPSSPSDGDRFFLTTDGQLYHYNGTASRWELEAEPGSIVASDKIVANTITGGLLATSGVITDSAQINNAVIKSANIDDLAVNRIKLALGSVSELFVYSEAISLTVNTYNTFVSTGVTATFQIPANALDAPEYIIVRGGVSSETTYGFVVSSSIQESSSFMRVRVFNETLNQYVSTGSDRLLRKFGYRGGLLPLAISGGAVTSSVETSVLVSTVSNAPEQRLILTIPPNSTQIRPGDVLRFETEIAKTRNFTDIDTNLTASAVSYFVEIYYR
jgi:hypothetical protein